MMNLWWWFNMFIKQILILVVEQSCLELPSAEDLALHLPVDLGGGYVMALCTLSLVHVMLLIFWHCCIGKLVEIGFFFFFLAECVFFIYCCFIVPRAFCHYEWIAAWVDGWQEIEKLCLCQHLQKFRKDRPMQEIYHHLLRDDLGIDHATIEDCGDIGSTCWHWRGNTDSNAVRFIGADAVPVQAGLWRLWWGSTSTSPW